MTLSIDIPNEAEKALREAWGSDLSRAALEALAIEGYRCGKLSRYDVQRLLGLPDRLETEEWLGRHGVSLNYTLEELEGDRAALNQAFGHVQD